MSLTGKTAGTHSHLARRIKKHSDLHTVTPAHREGGGEHTGAADQPRPFAPLKFEKEAPAAPSAYKSIFNI